MAKLPGWSYMIVGVIMMAFVKFIEAKQPATKLDLFFYLGIIFIIIGIIRETLPRLQQKQKPTPVGPPVQQAHHQQTHLHPAGNRQHGTSPHQTHQHVAGTPHPSHPYQPVHKQCPRCKQMAAGQARFCPTCGHQFY